MIKNDNKDNCKTNSGRIYSEKWLKSLKNGEILSILFTGVGGQGIILAAKVVAECAIASGFDVKVSEVHGMAQRGGSVEGSVRVGKKVFSPIINKADFIIALEKLEGLRYLSRLDSKGFIIINDYEIYPATVFLKGNAYPQDIENEMSKVTNNYIFIKAMEIAKKLNKIKTSNMVLLGALSNFIPFDYKIWVSAININVPREAVEVNIEAFNQGKKLI